MQQDGGTDLVTTGSKLGGAVGRVRYYGCAVRGEGANYDVEADEGGYYAPWVHGREVGNIVEEAAEEDVIAEGVYRSGFVLTLAVSPKRRFKREKEETERWHLTGR